MNIVGTLLKRIREGSQGTAFPSLSVPHRLAILYLMTPLVVWLVGWFQWWFGIPAAALLALGLWQALSGPWRVAPRLVVLALLLVAAAWVMVSAAGGVFDVHNYDWIKHRLVFLELGRGDWPIILSNYLEVPAHLRYYLGYYMVPGVISKLLGVAALNWAVPVWTWCGASLVLVLFTRDYRGWKVVAAAMILILFSGMDFVRTILLDGPQWLELRVGFDGWPWIGLGRASLESGHYGLPLMYASPTAALLWTPQHFIAAALYALLLFQLRHHGRFLAVSGVLVAASLFWSPLVGIGLLPFVVALLLENGIRPFLRWQNVFMALPLALLLVAYLSSGSVSSIPHGWLWTMYENVLPKLPRVIPAVYLSEFLLVAALLCVLRPRLLREPFFIASMATLLILPWYVFGLWNDLMTRGALTALVLLSLFGASVIVGEGYEIVRSGRLYRRAALAGLLVILGIGAVTPFFDLARANNDHDFNVFRYEQLGEDYSIVPILGARFHNQYVTYEHPGWLRRLLRNAAEETRTLDRGEQIIRSVYNVHLRKNRLVYIREQCSESEENSRFLLHTFPLNPDDRPGRLHDTLDFDFVEFGWQAENQCLAIRDLPSYDIGRIRTGQTNVSRTTHDWISNYYTEPYKDRLLEEAGEPLLRAGYAVYRHEHTLLYVKDSCSQADAHARFLLHVVPVDLRDLWNKLDQASFDVLDFSLSEFGDRNGERCYAIREIPEYPIKEIRTGQYNADGSLLWEGTIAIEEPH